MKLRVIETVSGRFVIQHQVVRYRFLTEWKDILTGGYYPTAADAVARLEQFLENERRTAGDRIVKRVIAEGEA
jgi:hypothetical protein